MSVSFHISDGSGGKVKAAVSTKQGKQGLVSLTEPLYDPLPIFTPLLNPTFGADMNQDIGAGGTPELIFNGGSGGTEWSPTTVQGDWDYADSGQVTLTDADDNDEALWKDGGTIAMTSYVALSGKITISGAYSGFFNDIFLSFQNNGTLVGNTVNLNDYIDTGSTAQQSFLIGKEDFGITTQTVDEFVIVFNTDFGFFSPDLSFDDFQIEAQGAPIPFSYDQRSTDRVKMSHVNITFVDNVTTADAQDYNSILGVSALDNGIVVNAVSKGQTIFNGPFTRLVDFLQITNGTTTFGGDGTNSWVRIEYDFSDAPIIFEQPNVDGLTFIVNDDLSGLLFFRVWVKLIRDT